MSSSSSKPFPEASKNLFGPSFVEKVKKRNETVKILLSAGSTKSQHAVFRTGTSSQFRPGRRVSFVGDHQTSYQASHPEDETHISGAGAGLSSQLLNQGRTMFYTKVNVVSQSNMSGMLPMKENLTFPIVKSLFDNLGLCSVEANNLPIAGRLQYLGKNWQVVTNDTWVLAAISGYCIPFTSIPHQEFLSSHTVSSED